MDVLERLERIEQRLDALLAKESPKDWYTPSELAVVLKKSEFTVREWCRLGRISAEKRKSGRGAHANWVVPHNELLRYQRHGLLPPKQN